MSTCSPRDRRRLALLNGAVASVAGSTALVGQGNEEDDAASHDVEKAITKPRDAAPPDGLAANFTNDCPRFGRLADARDGETDRVGERPRRRASRVPAIPGERPRDLTLGGRVEGVRSRSSQV
jgi:hypothetical protein